MNANSTIFPINLKVANYDIHVCNNYFPKYRFSREELKKEDAEAREAIWRFKDGYFSEAIGKNIAKGITDLYSREYLTGSVICIIPASTKDRTKLRFEKFCRTVSENTGLINGYDAINNEGDKAVGHLSGIKECILKYIKFDDKTFRWRQVFLFDDVITRGVTFQEVADALMAKGARGVTGIFLGKTVYNLAVNC